MPKFKIILNTIYQFGGRIITGLISIIIVKLISNYLGVSGYGEYTSTYEFLGFFAIFADFGIFTIAIREMSIYENNKKMLEKILGNILSIRLIFSIIMMGIALIALQIIPAYTATNIPNAAIIASFATIFMMISGTLSSVLQLFLQMGKYTYATILNKIIVFAYIVYTIKYAYPNSPEIGFYHLYIAGVVGGIIAMLLTAYFANKYVPITLKFDFKYWKMILKKAAPYGAAIILGQIYFKIDSILLLILKGKEDVGLYAVPMRILEVLTVIPFFFMNATLPTLTRAYKKNLEAFKKVIQFSFNFLVMTGVPIIVGGFILAYPLIFAISSPEFLSRVNEGFYGSDITFKILTIALVGSYLSTLFTYILVATDKQKIVLWINGAGVSFNIITNLLVIPILGARGAAYTSVASSIVVVIIASIICYKLFRIKLDFKPMFKIIISAAVMGCVLLLLRDPSYDFINMQNKNILFLIPLGGIIYSVMLIITGVLTKETLKSIKPNE